MLALEQNPRYTITTSLHGLFEDQKRPGLVDLAEDHSYPVRAAATFLEEQNQNHGHAPYTSPTPPHAATAAATVGQASSAHKASQISNSTLPRPVLGPKRFLCTQCDLWFNVSKNHDSACYSHPITTVFDQTKRQWNCCGRS